MLICQERRTGHRCGAINYDDAVYCAQCGRALRTALLVRDPGTIIGPYRVLGVIGYGGYGAVYEAEVVRRPDVRVALKETLSFEHVHGFRAEFLVLSALHHDNLPCYHDMFERDERGYLVMELIRGQSLKDIVRKEGGPVLERLALSYADQICDVLIYLHGQQPAIIHRDIKPDNVRITPEGLIKLVDFGLAKAGTETTAHKQGGTPAYAPPEQWAGGTDPRSDVYSLGATLFHLLTGRVPPPAALRQNLGGDPLMSPRDVNPRVSEQVGRVVLQSMALRPEQRYPDVESFHEALHAAGKASRSTRPLPRAAGTTPLYNVVLPVAPALYQREAGGPVKQLALAHATGALPRGVWRSTGEGASGLAWSPDGKTLAATLRDGRIILFEVSNDGQLRPVRSLPGHLGSALSIAWHPAQLIASSGRDQYVRLWSANDGSEQGAWFLRGHTLLCLAWEPGGSSLACGGWDGRVQLWRPGERQAHLSYQDHKQAVQGLAWEPGNGRRLATVSADGTLAVRRASDGVLLFQTPSTQQAIHSLSWSVDGRLIACAQADGQVRLFHSKDGSEAMTIRPHRHAVFAVTCSPDGQLVASAAANGTLGLWQVSDRERQVTLEGHAGPVQVLAWSPNGRILASAGDDRSVRLWEVR
jgi:eukaryotic-like serine/threonine-protein kinase